MKIKLLVHAERDIKIEEDAFRISMPMDKIDPSVSIPSVPEDALFEGDETPSYPDELSFGKKPEVEEAYQLMKYTIWKVHDQIGDKKDLVALVHRTLRLFSRDTSKNCKSTTSLFSLKLYQNHTIFPSIKRFTERFWGPHMSDQSEWAFDDSSTSALGNDDYILVCECRYLLRFGAC